MIYSPLPTQQWDIWQCLEIVLFVTTWWEGYYWHLVGIGILINTLMHRTVPPPPARKNYLVSNVSSAKAEKPSSTGGDNGLQWPQARGILHGHSMGAAGLLPQPWSPVQSTSHLLQPLDLICKELSQIPGCLVDLLLSKETRYKNLKFQRDQERQSKKREEMYLQKP